MLIIGVGDCRGGVSFFKHESQHSSCLLSDGEIASKVVQVAFYSRIHGTDPVTCITAVSNNNPQTGDQGSWSDSNGCVSLGQNGTIHIYLIRVSQTKSVGDDSSNGSGSIQVSVSLQSKMTTYPIVFPDQIFVSSVSVANPRWFVGGFSGDEYLICEFSKDNSRFQLLQAQGGGWKRPHHCRVSCGSDSDQSGFDLPAVTFVHCIPRKTGSEVAVTANYNLSPDKIMKSLTLPTHVQNMPSFFGKVGYCCTGIESVISNTAQYNSLYAVGGEDGILRVYAHTPGSVSSSAPAISSRHATLTVIQELVLNGFAPVRTVNNCYNPSRQRGLLIAGGGKLTYSIWSYSGPCTSCGVVDAHKPNPTPPLGCYFVSEVNGATIWNKATQDHRLLTISSALGNTTNVSVDGGSAVDIDMYYVLMGDSRGVVSVHSYCDYNGEVIEADVEAKNVPWNAPKCHPVEEFSCSEYPILASSVVALSTIGTESSEKQDGDVFVACFSFDRSLSLTGSLVGWTKRLVFQYEAHDMGVNCISSRFITNADQLSTITGNVVIATGGDDQAVCVAIMKIHCSPVEQCSLLSNYKCTVSTQDISRRPHASGSALKGVAVLDPIPMHASNNFSIAIATVGYDRRLFVWRVCECVSPDTCNAVTPLAYPTMTYSDIVSTSIVSNDRSTLQLECVQGYAVHIGDIGGLCVASRQRNSVNVEDVKAQSEDFNTEIGVVGEGFEVFILSNDA